MKLPRVISSFGAAVVGAFDVRDCTLMVGLCLLGGGLWLVWEPLAFIVPGLIIVYAALFGPGKASG